MISNIKKQCYHFYQRIGLAYIGRVGSTLVTVSISVERHLAIGHPTSHTPNKILFWAPILFSITYNIPKFFELAVCEAPEQLYTEQETNPASFNFSKVFKNNYTRNEQYENDSIDSFRLNPMNDEYSEQYKNDSIDSFHLNPMNVEYGIHHHDSTDMNTTSSPYCDVDGMRATPLRQNEWYIIFYVVISKVMFVEVIPWLSVIALNIWTWRKMVLFQKKREAMLKRGKQGN